MSSSEAPGNRRNRRAIGASVRCRFSFRRVLCRSILESMLARTVKQYVS